ncbi:GNAT family N-acetyltransferase [Pseudomonas sp. CDFA 602]|uniref:GNAT family N-acetyltransferase n=1 Tax=Pseudomonas californiensis TaxID=2829823 RepID=UPI001E5136EB|nr:GNAT family N-acetyltransferase [Pseudomonas californiensis]MCD5992585.1 GNAT family N-acetyltransferase [Pseudomonas californiensis]MCD5998137.1 GNAT family N-acetyltransferase [Pseudomonas californiensis]
MTVLLRKACVTDIPAIYRGEEDYIRRWEPDHEASWRLELGRHLSRWVENFDWLTVATTGGDFAGYSLWTDEQAYAELCTINVTQACRRRGIGRLLLDTFALDAASQGLTHLRLSVRPDNPAKLMYQEAGFRFTGTDPNGYLRYERSA